MSNNDKPKVSTKDLFRRVDLAAHIVAPLHKERFDKLTDEAVEFLVENSLDLVDEIYRQALERYEIH